jgi:hypothetical protein
METLTENINRMANDFSPKREGPLAKAIEKQTAKIPSDFWLWAAGASIIGSLVFQSIGMFGTPRSKAKRLLYPTRAPTANFVGMWAPTFLLLGIYNKLVKVAGSDQYDPA